MEENNVRQFRRWVVEGIDFVKVFTLTNADSPIVDFLPDSEAGIRESFLEYLFGLAFVLAEGHLRVISIL